MTGVTGVCVHSDNTAQDAQCMPVAITPSVAPATAAAVTPVRGRFAAAKRVGAAVTGKAAVFAETGAAVCVGAALAVDPVEANWG